MITRPRWPELEIDLEVRNLKLDPVVFRTKIQSTDIEAVRACVRLHRWLIDWWWWWCRVRYSCRRQTPVVRRSMLQSSQRWLNSCTRWCTSTSQITSPTAAGSRRSSTENSQPPSIKTRYFLSREVYGKTTGSMTALSLSLSLSLSLIFPDEPGLAGFIFYWLQGWWRWWWPELQDVQSSSQIITNKPTPNISMFYRLPNQHSVKAVKGKYHIPRTCSPQAHLGSPNFVFDHSRLWNKTEIKRYRQNIILL